MGGVDEKIEGFFEPCRARGLTGDQGVAIPAATYRACDFGRERSQA